MGTRNQTLPLFEDEPFATASRVMTIAVANGPDQRPLSKAQKTFNGLIKQIETQRARLAEWETIVPRYQKKYTSELVPLVESSGALQVEMVHCLDRAMDQKALNKTERRLITSLIVELAGELVASRNDAELKIIYNKHSKSDYDSDTAASMNGLKSLLEETLGCELGDDVDLSSPEDMLARAQERMRQEQAQYDAERQAQEERRSRRKKSAKQLAREERQQVEEQQISQSIREVYRKLASALHPDREPDPRERDRKTALMQRANQAYAKKNLLHLLELQLELEHIDQAALNNISEERLKHYNAILKEQLAELSQELLHVEGRFRAQFDISDYVAVSADTLMRRLASDIAEIKRAIRDMKKELLAFQDIKKLKAWLKEMRHSARHHYDSPDFDDCPF